MVVSAEWAEGLSALPSVLKYDAPLGWQSAGPSPYDPFLPSNSIVFAYPIALPFPYEQSAARFVHCFFFAALRSFFSC